METFTLAEPCELARDYTHRLTTIKTPTAEVVVLWDGVEWYQYETKQVLPKPPTESIAETAQRRANIRPHTRPARL